jgi:hypothetical protein
MKKILNWSIGSFFRTLGRIIAYLLIAFLITVILSKSDILSNLLFMNVNASTYNSFWLEDTDTITSGGIYDCSSESSCKEVYTQSSTFAINDIEVRGTISNRDKLKVGPNGNVLNIQGYLLKKDYFYSIDVYVCSSDNLSNLSGQIYGSYYNYWANDNLYNNTSRNSLHGLAGQQNTFNYCYMYSGLVAPNGDQTQINLRLRGSANVSTYYYMMGVHVESLGIYSGAIENIVENSGFATASSVEEVKQATNQVKQEIQSTNDTLNNSDTSEATNQASDLFNNYTDTDFGLSGVITAPLNLIRSLTSKTCSQFVLPIPFTDKTLTLPCLSPIYREHFNGILSIYQIVLFAIVGYRICISIFFMVKGFKDPNKDEIEVMDL